MAKSKNKGGKALGLAALLRIAVTRSGLSVYRIAKESNVDQSTLNKFMREERENLRIDIADRLFDCLGLRVAIVSKDSLDKAKQ